jgi:hypothetical protein
MNQTLFSPKKIRISDRLVLIPQFHGHDYFQKIKKKARETIRLPGSDLMVLPAYTLITGFLGYTHLLTILEFIEDIKEKKIFFLGTAGSLKEVRNNPCSLNIDWIFASSIFKRFSRKDRLDLLDLKTGRFEKAKAVSVDIVQRETRSWLKQQKRRGADAVEMELFPLRAYLGKPFYALLVLSDLVSESGIYPFIHSNRFKTEFRESFDFIHDFFSNGQLT